MDNEFVSFVRDDERVELADFTRDGGRSVFVRVVEETVWEELVAIAQECGYDEYGEYEHLETLERVRLFSLDESVDGERVTVYAPIEEP